MDIRFCISVYSSDLSKKLCVNHGVLPTVSLPRYKILLYFLIFSDGRRDLIRLF